MQNARQLTRPYLSLQAVDQPDVFETCELPEADQHVDNYDVSCHFNFPKDRNIIDFLF